MKQSDRCERQIEIYPPIFSPHEKSTKIYARARQRYAMRSYILLFFSLSMFGWLWEVILHFLRDGTFINRGILIGPWLPIYGTGGVLILLLLRRFAKHPLLTFFLTMILCSTVEYFTGWYLEASQGARWWDYSSYSFNLNGYICLQSALAFGIGGCLLIYYLAPWLNHLFQKIPVKVQWILCGMLLSLFGMDAWHAKSHPNMGKGITDYTAAIQKLFQKF